MRSEDIAWFAGLFEGEGCFSYDKKFQALRLYLGSTDLDILERIQQVLGVGSISKQKEKPNRKTFWMWYISKRKDVDFVCELIRPWLGVRRTARLNEIIELRAEPKATSKNSPFCLKGHERTWLGDRWVCKPCRAEAQIRYMDDPERREKAKQYSKEYYKDHQEEAKQYAKEYYNDHSNLSVDLSWLPSKK